MGSVWIAGSYQSDYARNYAREGLEISDMVEGRLRRTDCPQVTDGVAGVLLVSDRYRAERLGGKPSARIAGWGHGTAALPLQPKLDRSQGQPYVFPHVRQVVTDAFRRAQIPGVGAVSFVVTAEK
jgi:acetyl-CoA C-acetyltransferase